MEVVSSFSCPAAAKLAMLLRVNAGGNSCDWKYSVSFHQVVEVLMFKYV
jgi:hypothetical protein